MAKFAVIDTETNWNDAVMSIGVVLADSTSFELVSSRYYILTPEYKAGGMFSHTLFFEKDDLNIVCSREKALNELIEYFAQNNVADIFAYNAAFDYRHLPELSFLCWYDIMKLAAYRQHNPKIPKEADCCKTGRLKSGYGVEAILRLLSENQEYFEKHNALTDAVDELKIMTLLRHDLCRYIKI